jgi:hypothetical protein
MTYCPACNAVLYVNDRFLFCDCGFSAPLVGERPPLTRTPSSRQRHEQRRTTRSRLRYPSSPDFLVKNAPVTYEDAFTATHETRALGITEAVYEHFTHLLECAS